MKTGAYRIISLVVFVCSVFTLIVVFAGDGFDNVQSLGESNKALVVEEERIPREEATLLLVTNDRLFVQYEKTRLINVYTITGEFVCGIKYGDFRNGVARMGFEDGTLYIKARGYTYVFTGKDVYPYHEAETSVTENRRIRELCEKPPQSNMEGKYKIADNELLRITDEGVFVIKEFPKQNQNKWLIFLIVFLVNVLLLAFFKSKDCFIFSKKSMLG